MAAGTLETKRRVLVKMSVLKKKILIRLRLFRYSTVFDLALSVRNCLRFSFGTLASWISSFPLPFGFSSIACGLFNSYSFRHTLALVQLRLAFGLTSTRLPFNSTHFLLRLTFGFTSVRFQISLGRLLASLTFALTLLQ